MVIRSRPSKSLYYPANKGIMETIHDIITDKEGIGTTFPPESLLTVGSP